MRLSLSLWLSLSEECCPVLFVLRSPFHLCSGHRMHWLRDQHHPDQLWAIHQVVVPTEPECCCCCCCRCVAKEGGRSLYCRCGPTRRLLIVLTADWTTQRSQRSGRQQTDTSDHSAIWSVCFAFGRDAAVVSMSAQRLPDVAAAGSSWWIVSVEFQRTHFEKRAFRMLVRESQACCFCRGWCLVELDWVCLCCVVGWFVRAVPVSEWEDGWILEKCVELTNRPQLAHVGDVVASCLR